MHLYHLTLQRPTSITAVAYGSFTGPKKNEIAICSGSRLRIVSPDKNTGTLHLVSKCAFDVLGILRSIVPIRLVGFKYDHLVLISDAGNLTIVKIDETTGNLVRVQCEPYGKSGYRRTVPSQYVCVDPKGRAIMIGAIERNKLAYLVSWDQSKDENYRLVVSSPMDAHRNGAIYLDMIALDVGYDNPAFACLEMLKEEEEEDMPENGDMRESYNASFGPPTRSKSMLPPKSLAIYELDLGLNHVTRKSTIPVHNTCHKLIPLPSGPEGACGGILALCMGQVTYYPPSSLSSTSTATSASTIRKAKVLTAQLPVRDSKPVRPDNILISSYAVYNHKGLFFVLLCTEHGDLIKVEFVAEKLATSANGVPIADAPIPSISVIKLKYFDTLSSGSAKNLTITRNGFLYAVFESNDHVLYSVKSLATEKDDDGSGETSSEYPCLGYVDAIPPQVRSRVFFLPRDKQKNLVALDIQESLSPLISVLHEPVNSKSELGPSSKGRTYDLMLTSGRYRESKIVRMVRGLAVSELAMSELPFAAHGVFCLQCGDKIESADSSSSVFSDRFILVSSESSTLALEIGESIQEVSYAGFVLGSRTIAAASMLGGNMLQVCESGARLLSPPKQSEDDQAENPTNVLSEWKPASTEIIVKASISLVQAVLVTSSKNLVYLELNPENWSLRESSRIRLVGSISLTGFGGNLDEVSFPGCSILDSHNPLSSESPLALSISPPPLSEQRSKFLAVGVAKAVRIFALDKQVVAKTIQVIPENVSAISFARVDTRVLALFIGTTTGLLVRSSVDDLEGALSDRSTRFLGVEPVRFASLRVEPSLFSYKQEIFGNTGYENYFPLLVIGETNWLAHRLEFLGPGSGSVTLNPLSCDKIHHASSFVSEQVPVGGVVWVTDNVLRVACMDKLDHVLRSGFDPVSEHLFFNNSYVRVRGTPRRIARLSLEPLPPAIANGTLDNVDSHSKSPSRDSMVGFITADHAALLDKHGRPQSSNKGHWASRIGVMSISNELKEEEEEDHNLDDADDGDRPLLKKPILISENIAYHDCSPNESAVSFCQLEFWNGDSAKRSFMCVGLSKNYCPDTTSLVSVNRPGVGAIRTFNIYPSGTREKAAKSSSVSGAVIMEFMHDTELEYPALALSPFGGRLLVGSGNSLLLYDLGKKKLLRKCILPNVVKTKIVAICHLGGERIVVADVQESVSLVAYDVEMNRFVLVARDSVSRWVTSLYPLDYSTIAVGDKFGNVAILSFPVETNKAVLASAHSTGIVRNTPGLASIDSMHLMTCEACFYVGSLVTGFKLVDFGSGQESLLYFCLDGAVGAMLPLTSAVAIDFVTKLEIAMRNIRSPRISLVDRDHISYRSAFYPVKNIVDGDLCEKFPLLSAEEQAQVLEGTTFSARGIFAKLQDLRHSVL